MFPLNAAIYVCGEACKNFALIVIHISIPFLDSIPAIHISVPFLDSIPANANCDCITCLRYIIKVSRRHLILNRQLVIRIYAEFVRVFMTNPQKFTSLALMTSYEYF